LLKIGCKINQNQVITSHLDIDLQGMTSTLPHVEKVPFISSSYFVSNRAIAELLPDQSYLNYAQLAAVRELMETAQHFWEVEARLQFYEDWQQTPTVRLEEFIQLLRRGTISANPRPLYSLGRELKAVTLATIFQYRSLRKAHRWQFWLDVASPLWKKGGAATLQGASLFLREPSHEGSLRDDRARGADRHDGAHLRRKRHGQGTRRQGHPCLQLEEERQIPRRQLRRSAGAETRPGG
jgi:hypothetical protein